jgi:dihydrodipicolinate synthase/N-acetylneuraminate lyase
MTMSLATEVMQLVQPGRKIEGNSAILLPFCANGEIDWRGFAAHVQRTAAAGLTPAINMDTGYGNLIDDTIRLRALEITRSELGIGRFLAGAFVVDAPGATFNLAAYAQQMHMIEQHGGIPVIFQSYGLTTGNNAAILSRYQQLATKCNAFIGFELGTMFAPFGKIYSLDLYGQIMQIQNCLGAKHSSLQRELEWERLQLRNAQRPDFRVYTGNDLAIDMVMYGSDYLLGLSTCAPDLFAKRDAAWLAGDASFYELNDFLQYLGCFAFRNPVPAYKHSAAMFLKLRGWIQCDATHSQSPLRPDSDRAVLQEMVTRIEKL